MHGKIYESHFLTIIFSVSATALSRLFTRYRCGTKRTGYAVRRRRIKIIFCEKRIRRIGRNDFAVKEQRAPIGTDSGKLNIMSYHNNRYSVRFKFLQYIQKRGL